MNSRQNLLILKIEAQCLVIFFKKNVAACAHLSSLHQSICRWYKRVSLYLLLQQEPTVSFNSLLYLSPIGYDFRTTLLSFIHRLSSDLLLLLVCRIFFHSLISLSFHQLIHPLDSVLYKLFVG